MPDPSPAGVTARPTSQFDALISPTSVAVIGASADREKVGGRPIDYLIRSGFKGAILPVNPRGGMVQGLPAVQSIDELPEGVDLAVVAVASTKVPEVIRRCGARGVKAAVVFSAGFKEAGLEGQVLEDELRRAIDATGILVCGPNSSGIMNNHIGLAATFISGPGTTLMGSEGDIALIAQSGAVTSYLYEWCSRQGLALSHLVSVGNESSAEIADYLSYFAELDGVRAIGLYIEGVADGRPLIAAADKARNNDRLVAVLKTGQSTAGARAALSHTGSLVGTDRVHDGAYRQHGMVRVEDAHQMIDTLRVAHEVRTTRTPPRGVAILTTSGGMGVWTVDALAKEGLTIADLGDETKARLRQVLPTYGSADNPVDVTGQTVNDPGIIPAATEVVLGDPNVDLVVVAIAYQTNGARQIAQDLCRLAHASNKTVLTCWMFAPEGIEDVFRDEGLPYFDDLIKLIRGLCRLVEWQRLPANRGPSTLGVTARGLDVSQGLLTEDASKSFIADIGIHIPRGASANSAEEAVAHAEEIGYPVILKGMVEGVAHKSQAGLVRLNCRSAVDVAQAHAALSGTMAGLEGGPGGYVLVEQQVESVAELVVSAGEDPVFGPVVMCGTGGTDVEASTDLVFRTLPVADSETLSMAEQVGMFDRLDPSERIVRRAVVAQVIGRVGAFYWANRKVVRTVELNPVAISKRNTAVALDALIETRGEP